LLNEIERGKSYLEFHDSAHRRIARLLSEFELVKTSAEETYAKGYNQCFFPCGVEHYIGLQAHDVGGYMMDCTGREFTRDARYLLLRLNRPMEQDIVFTVEPGIYLIDQLLNQHADNPDFNWSRINQLKPYGGFRLEDCIALTAQGVENLSQRGFQQLGH
jgi:Xaa-Pro dipeptidase